VAPPAPALAEAGYRAVAIDVRGYGRSSKPSAVEDYRMVRLVADNVGLVAALGEETATIVGHDWGAPIAWTSAMLRPDVFTAVAGLSVPFSPPSEHHRPLEMMRAMAGDEEFYVEYFQEPGRAEAEIEADVRDWLLGFMFTASGDAPPPDPAAGTVATVPHGALMKDRFHRPDTMPTWLTDDDVDAYTSEFEHSGSAARSTGTATSIATGRTSPRSAAHRSGCRRCSWAATVTDRRCGARRPSPRSAGRCRNCTARPSSRGAATGPNRSGPTRSTRR
jgi:pimeloyl-ACP methyl ester carboxylesterase